MASGEVRLEQFWDRKRTPSSVCGGAAPPAELSHGMSSQRVPDRRLWNCTSAAAPGLMSGCEVRGAGAWRSDGGGVCDRPRRREPEEWGGAGAGD